MKRRVRRVDMGELPMSNKADEKIAQQPGPKRSAPFRPQTLAQEQYSKQIRGRMLTIGAGCAGTGKTFCSVSLACEMLAAGQVERIIATRPAVTAEEDLGFTPGTLSEKFAPYFEPILDVLNRKLGASYVTHAIKVQKVIALPLGYMRGLTFQNAFVLCDEAQNTTQGQMKMLLTRLGEPVKCVIEGDEEQSDIRGPNGLVDAIQRFQGHPDVGLTRFTEADVVRSGFVRDVLMAYRNGQEHPTLVSVSA